MPDDVLLGLPPALTRLHFASTLAKLAFAATGDGMNAEFDRWLSFRKQAMRQGPVVKTKAPTHRAGAFVFVGA